MRPAVVLAGWLAIARHTVALSAPAGIACCWIVRRGRARRTPGRRRCRRLGTIGWAVTETATGRGEGRRRGLRILRVAGVSVLHESARLVDAAPGAGAHRTVGGGPVPGDGRLSVEDGRDLARGLATSQCVGHRPEFGIVVGFESGHWNAPPIGSRLALHCAAESSAESSVMHCRGAVAGWNAEPGGGRRAGCGAEGVRAVGCRAVRSGPWRRRGCLRRRRALGTGRAGTRRRAPLTGRSCLKHSAGCRGTRHGRRNDLQISLQGGR